MTSRRIVPMLAAVAVLLAACAGGPVGRVRVVGRRRRPPLPRIWSRCR